MKIKTILYTLFLIPIQIIQAQVPGWEVYPEHVAFKYFDGMYEQEWSHWTPTNFSLWADNTYNIGINLIPSLLEIFDEDQHVGLDLESLVFHKNIAGPFVEVVRLDYDGLNFLNGAMYKAMDIYIRGLGGQVDLFNGLNNQYLVRLGSTSENSYQGNLRLYGPNGAYRQYHAVSSENYGYSYWYGQNGLPNIYMGISSGYPNRGRIIIYDQTETQQAGIYINDFGQGVVWGDIKSFSMQHPTREDSEIWYASLEGPEAGAYERGTATLQYGEAYVSYSEHYQIVANPKTMTVSLTPHEWDTYGLAVVEKTDKGFKVKELKGGQGNFSFDWEVKCVRKGYENFQVLREKNQSSYPSSPVVSEEEPEMSISKPSILSTLKIHKPHKGCVLNK